MMYYIFTLKFLTPVHFGDTANGGSLDKFSLQCSADTLLAALCNEAANKGYVDTKDAYLQKRIETLRNERARPANRCFQSKQNPYDVQSTNRSACIRLLQPSYYGYRLF